MPRKGKYADIIDKLPKTLGTEPEYQTKVNAVKMAILDPEEKPESPFAATDLERHTEMDIDKTLLVVNANLGMLNNLLIAANAGQRTGAALARAWRHGRQIMDVIDEQVSEIGVTMEALKQLIVDQYENEGVSMIRMEDGGSVSAQPEPKVQVMDREAFRLWCIANGLERSLQLPWQTANALTKERLLAGDAEPDGTQAFAATKLVLRK